MTMAAHINNIHGLAHASVVVVAATRTGMIAVIEALVVGLVEDALVVVVVTAVAAVADPIAPNGH